VFQRRAYNAEFPRGRNLLVLQELREEEFMSCDLNALEHNEKQLSTIYSDVL
jgi:hypothetical protein